VDYSSPSAPILADAHALPFESNSLDFVLSIAVLEHLRYPLVAMSEVYRVLKPGGYFIGTVAFLEPFHGNSYYHHTHLGSFTSLSAVGFLIDRIGANARWSGLRAQASMGGLFPRMPESLARTLVLPLELLSRLWWFVGRFVTRRVTRSQRLVTNTGSFEFVAHKPA
jgi:SAM-dependent methyltransferase